MQVFFGNSKMKISSKQRDVYWLAGMQESCVARGNVKVLRMSTHQSKKHGSAGQRKTCLLYTLMQASPNSLLQDSSKVLLIHDCSNFHVTLGSNTFLDQCAILCPLSHSGSLDMCIPRQSSRDRIFFTVKTSPGTCCALFTAFFFLLSPDRVPISSSNPCFLSHMLQFPCEILLHVLVSFLVIFISF